jgi:signal transduction histidine kinase/ligand-binding sensor domain-containing protein
MSLTKRLLIFFALTTLAQPLLALNPDSRLSQYGHRVWRVQDGVLSGNPTAFAQTPDGYIWVGTQNGLYLFDGVNFRAWNPPSGQQYPSGVASIYSIYAAKDGSLWIGTGAGLAHWAGGKFAVISGQNAAVAAIAEDNEGGLWITRTHQHQFTGPICKISAGSEQCFGAHDGLQTESAGPIATDAQGRFWVGGNGTLVEWRGKLVSEHILPGSTVSDVTRVIEGVAVDAEGIVWAGVARPGPHDGLQRFSNGQWSSYTAPGFDGTQVNIRTLFLDRDNCLWVGTENQGIYRIHGQSVDHLARADGLSSNSIYRIFQDREGAIWVATGEGIDQFRDLPIVTYSSIEGLGTETINSILSRHDGSVTVSTVSSIDSIQGSAVTPENVPSELRGNSLSMLEDSGGNLWVGMSDGGLQVQVNGQWRSIFNGHLTGVVNSLAEDTDHAVWAVVNGPNPRLLRIENFQIREEFKPPTVPASYSVIADPQGGIWVSLLGGGLFHYRSGEWQEISMQPLVRKYARVGAIFNLWVDSGGTLWGAANRGVIAYRKGNLQFLNERNGLPCAATYATITDVHDDLWILTRCGLVQIKKPELERWWADPESRLQVSTFTATDGFRAGIPLSHPAAVRSTDGKLWFQNRSVVLMADPERISANMILPPVHVDQVIADHRDYEARNDLHFPPRTRELEIHYVGLSFIAPSKVLFRYLLEGYDTQWQDAGTRRVAFYNDLPPGKYSFRVIASNNSGLWNDERASLDFSIAPAYYQTIWFRALLGVIFASLLWTVYRLWLRQMQQQFNIALDARVNERTRIARELHDTLLQSLHGLMFKFQAVRNMLPRRPKDAIQTLDEAISETEQAIAESRDAIHDLRSQPVSEQDLGALLEAAGEELAAAQRTDQNPPHFRLIAEGEPRKLPSDLHDEVHKIARELLRNAFQHAEARQIEVEIRYDRNQLRVRIRDDGKGIDPKVLEESRRPGHWGLPGVRERAATIGSQLSFWSQPEAGTEVELTIPAAIAYAATGDERRFKLFRRSARR